MIEKQQRAFLKQTGTEKPIMEILREASTKYFMPLFRGTIPLMGHSLASAILGLVGQPRYACTWRAREGTALSSPSPFASPSILFTPALPKPILSYPLPNHSQLTHSSLSPSPEHALYRCIILSCHTWRARELCPHA